MTIADSDDENITGIDSAKSKPRNYIDRGIENDDTQNSGSITMRRLNPTVLDSRQ